MRISDWSSDVCSSDLGGRGVMLANNNGTWSYPAFYTLASGSLGLQAGVQTAEVAMFVMTDRALQALLSNQLKFGGQAGLRSEERRVGKGCFSMWRFRWSAYT